MRSVLFSTLIYSSLILFFIFTAYVIIGQKFFSHSLLSLRSILRLYFFSFVSLLVVFGGSFFAATGQAPLVEMGMLFLLALTVQIQTQIAGESKLRGLNLKRFSAQVTVMRHWVVVLLGTVILIGLNAGFSFVLLSLAKTFQLGEVSKDLVLWLRAPFAIYVCQMIFEFLRGFLLRFEFHASQIKGGDLFDSVQKIARHYQLKVKKIYGINLEEYGFNFILGHKSLIFISPKIYKTLDQREFEFLVVQGLLSSKLKLERQRILHYTIFSLGLFLPYFIAGQGLDYILPNLWALTVWKFLSLLLFIVQQILKKGIDSLQFAIKCQSASDLLHYSFKEMGALYQKINQLNLVNLGPRVILGLPQPPTLFQVAEKQLVRAQTKASQKKQTLTFSATILVVLTFCLVVGSIVVLTPKYKLRAAASKGNMVEVNKLLKSGMSANSVDILSNVTPTPLLAAANGGKTSVVKLLLENGADANKKVPLPFSALDLAVQSGDLEMVKSLVEHGAKVETSGYKGLTALMWAARLNNISIMEYLIKHGAKLNARSDHKSTALMLASQVGNTVAVKLLIRSGADVRFRDADHDSALELATKKHFTIIEKIIIEAERHGRTPAAQK